MTKHADQWEPKGPFGIVKDTDVQGGYRVVAVENDLTDIDQIPPERQTVGMLVFVQDTKRTFRLETKGVRNASGIGYGSQPQFTDVTPGAAGSGIAGIGDAVVSGSDNSVLFVDADGKLAQDNPAFTYNANTNTLTVAGVITGTQLQTSTGIVTSSSGSIEIQSTDQGAAAPNITLRAANNTAQGVEPISTAGNIILIPGTGGSIFTGPTEGAVIVERKLTVNGPATAESYAISAAESGVVTLPLVPALFVNNSDYAFTGLALSDVNGTGRFGPGIQFGTDPQNNNRIICFAVPFLPSQATVESVRIQGTYWTLSPNDAAFRVSLVSGHPEDAAASSIVTSAVFGDAAIGVVTDVDITVPYSHTVTSNQTTHLWLGYTRSTATTSGIFRFTAVSIKYTYTKIRF